MADDKNPKEENNEGGIPPLGPEYNPARVRVALANANIPTVDSSGAVKLTALVGQNIGILRAENGDDGNYIYVEKVFRGDSPDEVKVRVTAATAKKYAAYFAINPLNILEGHVSQEADKAPTIGDVKA